MNRKLNLPLYVIRMLWWLLAFVSLWVFAVFTLFFFEIFVGHPLKSGPYFSAILTIIISAEFLLIALWRISTFRRRDLERVMKREGVQVKKRNPIFLLFQSCFFSSFPQGPFRDSYVISKITGAYNLPTGLESMIRINAENILTDRIDFISLINSPFNIDEEIRIEKKERRIPNTGVPEIDTVLQESLYDTDDFRARLIFNNEYFRLIVVSSPWLGGKYEKRVVKGFEIFKKMDEALRKKYPHKKWEGLEMEWNGHKYEFEPKRITA